MGQRQEKSVEPCTGVDLAMTRVFALLGKRWTGLIVSVLTQRAVYFSELRRAIPKISERMLSDRLTELAEAGLLTREVEEGPPLRVSYRLTEAGRALTPALDELGKWATTYLPEDSGCKEAAAARATVGCAEETAGCAEEITGGANGLIAEADPGPDFSPSGV